MKELLLLLMMFNQKIDGYQLFIIMSMRYILAVVIVLLNIIAVVLFATGFSSEDKTTDDIKYMIFYPGMFFILEATLGLILVLLKCRINCSCNCINTKPNPEETELLSRPQNSVNAVYNSI